MGGAHVAQHRSRCRRALAGVSVGTGAVAAVIGDVDGAPRGRGVALEGAGCHAGSAAAEQLHGTAVLRRLTRRHDRGDERRFTGLTAHGAIRC